MSTTTDPAEIAKFSALAAEWWNPKGPFGALHRLNPVRLQYIRDVAAQYLSSPASGGSVASEARDEGGATAQPSNDGARTAPSGSFADSSPTRGGAKRRRALEGVSTLDLGCGGGLVSAPLARMGAKLTAIDASAEAIGAASAYAEQAGLDIDFQNTAAEALVEQGAQFQLVTALEIIEHVADVNAFLSAASALVAPGGLLILSTINRTPKARALAITGAERILKWAPEGAHDYDKLVTPDEIRAGAPALHWDEPVGVTYQPLGSGWAISRDIDVNYMMAGRRSA
ncbi:MAG: bifunctional 2-polyprenyl-6-hydroxyphenol methylase/3-demethylubiquinol 3-O-methyltransferase UbiG [Hyphomonadaceae bacterium]|nr:bifunctional 2-polyprenyl-6-hydroxyphenol methylase/3-demethylubiquinol 3-O-methyltransferase UbiG [Hyphomonadaceae bacterium]